MDAEAKKSRREELLGIIGDNKFLQKEVEEVLFLEEQLDYFRSLPQIEVHPKHPEKQRPTVASKQYIKYLQQYNNVIRTLTRATAAGEDENESPLRAWLRQNAEENLDT